MINANIKIDTEEVMRLATKFPVKFAPNLRHAIELSGRMIERNAKINAPVDTGKLQQNIFFKSGKDYMGIVEAKMEYAGFVHGNPFWKPSSPRKTTPFLTDAVEGRKKDIERNFSRAIDKTLRQV